MSAVYRVCPRTLLLLRKSCNGGHFYSKVSKHYPRYLQLVLSRNLADFVQKDKLFKFDIFDLIAENDIKDASNENKVEHVKNEHTVGDDSVEIKAESKQVNKLTRRHEEDTAKDQKLGKTLHKNKNKKSSLKAQFDHINLLNSHVEVSDYLSYILNNAALYQESDIATIVHSFKRLEALNDMQLHENASAMLVTYFDRYRHLEKVPINAFKQILAFCIKSSKEDSKLAFTFLHEATWRLRKAELPSILDLINVVKLNCTTNKRREFVQEAEKKILDLIGSVESPSMMLSVTYLLLSKPEMKSRVEEELYQMLPTMDPLQTYKVFYLLALNKSRDVDLIHKAKLQLLSRPISLDLKKSANLLYACDSLRLLDKMLLQEICLNVIDCLSKSEDVSLSDVLPILTSCSRMGWNYVLLTDMIMKIIENSSINVTKLQYREKLASVVVSAGHLNLPQYGDICIKLANRLQSLKSENPGLWLDVVYSLACIRMAELNDVKAVLNTDFYKALLDNAKDKPTFLQDNLRRKLLSLYGYMKVDLDQPTSDIDGVAAEWRNQLQENTKRNLSRMATPVSSVLALFAPLENYTYTNVITRYGTNVELELFLDLETGKAVRHAAAEGKQRIWVKVLEFKDFIRKNSEPEHSGNTVMAIRHLNEEKDVHIVYVSYVEWNNFNNRQDQLQFLEGKIKEVVPSKEETE